MIQRMSERRARDRCNHRADYYIELHEQTVRELEEVRMERDELKDRLAQDHGEATLLRQRDAAREQLKDAMGLVNRASDKLERLRGMADDERAQRNKARRECENLRSALASVKEQIDQERKVLANYQRQSIIDREKRDELTEANRKLEGRIETLVRLLKERSAERDAALAEVELLKGKYSKTTRDLDEAARRVNIAMDRGMMMAAAVESLKKEVAWRYDASARRLEKQCEVVLNTLAKAGGEIPKSALQRVGALRSLDSKEFTELLQTLQGRNKIIIVMSPSKSGLGRPAAWVCRRVFAKKEDAVTVPMLKCIKDAHPDKYAACYCDECQQARWKQIPVMDLGV